MLLEKNERIVFDKNRGKELFMIQEDDIEFVKKNKSRILRMFHRGWDHESAEYVIEEHTKMTGGQGEVFKATNPKNNTPVALKCFQLCLVNDNDTFFREAEFYLNLQMIHENIMKIDEIFFKEEEFGAVHLAYLVMPWFEYDLLSWITMEKHAAVSWIAMKCKRTFEEVRNVLIQAMKALQHIHYHRIVHADIKFQNFLVDENNKCVLTDFGFVKDLGNITSTKGFTPGYCAPELHSEKGPVFSISQDIYSFGVMLYELFVDSSYERDLNLITKDIIRERIEKVFQKNCKIDEKKEVDESIIEDLCNIIKSSLDVDPLKREDSMKLLNFHQFFSRKPI